MRVSLFSESARTRLGPAKYGESIVAYLDSSAEPDVMCVCAVLDEWFARYPLLERPRLAADFRSTDDRQWLGAFWELYLHESFRRGGFLVECHPNLGDSSTRPDFRVSNSDGHFYVEARLVGPSDREVNEQRREAQVRDALARVKADLFFLAVELVAFTEHSPSGRRLRKEVEAWLETLDADRAIATARRDLSALPRRRFRADGWEFDIQAHPVSVDRRGRPRRAVGIYGPNGFVRVDTASDIRDRLNKKAGRYEGLDAPLVPALLVHESSFADDRHVLDALYGTECVRFNLDRDRGVTGIRHERKHDGAWTTPLDRSGKLVPGVIVAIRLGPSNVNRRAPVYWRNPLAEDLPCSLPWQVRFPGPDGYLKTSGVFDPASYFGLSLAWPANAA